MKLSLYDVFNNRLLVAACAVSDDELRASEQLARECFARALQATDGLAVFSDRPGFVRTAFYNPDCSFERLCGNSLFVAAQLFVHAGESIAVKPFDCPEITLAHSADGFLLASAEFRLERRAVAAGDFGTIRVYDTGSPHAVVWSESGAEMPESAAAFARDQNLNLTVIHATGRSLHARTFERGVFAETAACGTGALAAAIASERRDEWIDVLYPGGSYSVLIRDRGDRTAWTLRVPTSAVRLTAVSQLTTKPAPESLPARAPRAAPRSRTRSG